MIVRIITVYVKSANTEEFEHETTLNHEGSVKESGVLRFDVLRDAEEAGRYVLYEVYRDNEAIAAHKETAHYARWKQAVEPMMAAPRDAQSCEVVAPVHESQW